MLLGRRIRTVGRLHAVVDADRRTALELDLSAGDDLDALVEALEDRDLIPARGPGGDEGLLDHERVRRQLRPLAGLLGRPLILLFFFRRVVVRGRRRGPFCGTWKSTEIGSSCCSVTIVVPGLR